MLYAVPVVKEGIKEEREKRKEKREKRKEKREKRKKKKIQRKIVCNDATVTTLLMVAGRHESVRTTVTKGDCIASSPARI